jgi:TIR domain
MNNIKNICVPRVFISYAWTNQEYREWVIQLGERLKSSGVNVLLDAWALSPGADVPYFMEQSVSDASVTHVLLLCNADYARKANERQGGVGTETMILSPEVYDKHKNKRYIPVITQRSAEDQFIPTFLQHKHYVDLSAEASFEAGYEQLLRHLFNKPLYVEPPLGTPPSYITLAPLVARCRAIIDGQRGNLNLAVTDFANRYAQEVAALQINEVKQPLDEQVYERVQQGLPLQKAYAELVSLLCMANDTALPRGLMVGVLQSVYDACHFNVGGGGYRGQLEPAEFLFNETLTNLTAILLRHSRFQELNELVQERLLHLNERSPRSLLNVSFSLDHLREHRKERLKVEGVVEKMLKERAGGPVSFSEFQQADFVLYALSGIYKGWWAPRTLAYVDEYTTFPLFLKAGSPSLRAKLPALFGASNESDLSKRLVQLVQNKGDELNGSQSWHRLRITKLMNLKELFPAAFAQLNAQPTA